MKKTLLVLAALTMMVMPATAQKSILTGGVQGAYNSTFCPPIPSALDKAYLQGYRCKPSGGTLDNMTQVLAQPTNLGFAQLDVFARELSTKPDLSKKLALVRSDVACEGLWMVTKNDKFKSYGDILGLARRIPFVLPAQNSGSAASFEFLKSIDPQGLGRAENIKYLTDATSVINYVSTAQENPVGFFVQFADPENGNIKLMMEKGLTIIPVVSREITQTKVEGQDLYQIQSFNLTSSGLFTSGKEVVTACTPVAVFTGSPDAMGTPNAKDNQKDLIDTARAIPTKDMLPQDSRMAKLISSVKKVSGSALDEMLAAADKARKAAAQQLN